MISHSICVFQVHCREHMKQRGSYWKAEMFRSSRMPELGKWHSVNMRENAAQDHWDLPEDFQKFFDDPVGFRPGKGGESFADVRKRTGEFLESLYKKAEGVYGNILITTHGAALAGILNNIRKEPLEKYWGIGVHSNCAVTEVEVKNAEAKILSENVTYYKETVRPWAGN